MKISVFVLLAGVSAASAATAQTYGRPAYPDNWNGGAPLPPIYGTTYAETQSYRTNTSVTYVQPYAAYTQPQVVYVAPQVYVWGGYDSRRTTGPLVDGPPQSRCIVSTLNGTDWSDGCAGRVHINPADIPYLRAKFSAWRLDSGVVTNLPTDSEYR